MKTLTSAIRLILCGCAVCAFFLCTPAAAQTASDLYNFIAILPGSTRSIDIRQAAPFPFGCPQFFVAVMGKGTLGISLKKDDRAGDVIFMTGIATSSAGTVPIYRLGVSKGMIDQIIEIGDSDQPYGFVWIYCGVAYSGSIPVFASQLRLSLAP